MQSGSGCCGGLRGTQSVGVVQERCYLHIKQLLTEETLPVCMCERESALRTGKMLISDAKSQWTRPLTPHTHLLSLSFSLPFILLIPDWDENSDYNPWGATHSETASLLSQERVFLCVDFFLLKLNFSNLKIEILGRILRGLFFTINIIIIIILTVQFSSWFLTISIKNLIHSFCGETSP